MSNFSTGLVVPIPTLPPLVIRARSVLLVLNIKLVLTLLFIVKSVPTSNKPIPPPALSNLTTAFPLEYISNFSLGRVVPMPTLPFELTRICSPCELLNNIFDPAETFT